MKPDLIWSESCSPNLQIAHDNRRHIQRLKTGANKIFTVSHTIAAPSFSPYQAMRLTFPP